MPELKPSVLGYYDVFFLLKFLTFQLNRLLFHKTYFWVLGYGKTRLFSFTISPFFWNVLGKTHIRKCLFLVVGPFPSDKKFKKMILNHYWGTQT